MESSHFGITDYVVFSLVLAVSAMIGIYYRLTGGKQQTTKEYLMADKSMSVFPVAFSLMASFMSAITLLGVSKENYVYGTQFVVINFSYIFGTFIAAFLYLPVFFKLQTTSAYEYLELRFGKITRLIASGSFVFQMVLYMSIVLYAPAIALSAVTGFSKWASILSVGLVCTFYSTIGGMKAVLWTDVFQSLLMFAAIFAVIVKGAMDSNGLSEVWDIAVAGGRIKFFDMNPDPTVRHTFWTQIIGGIFTYTSLYGVNQAQVQRLLTVQSLRKSQIALFLNWPILTFLSLTTSFSGLIIYSKYYDCDPLMAKRISSSDQILPIFVMDYLAHLPGLAGLFVSGIFSAALSTVSSAVNSLAAVTLEDFIKPHLGGRWQSDKTLAVLTKSLACTFGFLCVALTFVAERLGGVLQASLTIFGIVGGPLLGLFSLGMFCPRSTQRGAIFGFVIGIIFSSWMGFGASITMPYIPVLPTSIDGCPAKANETTNVPFTNVSTQMPLQEATSDFTSMFSNTTSSFNESFTTPDPWLRNENIWYLYRISYMWYAPLGFLCVMLFGILVSLCDKKRAVNPDYLSPVWSYCYPNTDSFELNDNELISKHSSRTDKEKTYSLVSCGMPDTMSGNGTLQTRF